MTATTAGRSTAGRWVRFYVIGGIGFLVQLVVLGVLVEWVGLDFLVATALATETAVLHNFVWHECWTWRDRTAIDGAGLWGRLLRFNAASGTVSVVGNVVFTGLFAGLFGLHYAVANVLAIATCSLLNFLVADRFVFVARTPENAPQSGAAVRHGSAGARPEEALHVHSCGVTSSAGLDRLRTRRHVVPAGRSGRAQTTDCHRLGGLCRGHRSPHRRGAGALRQVPRPGFSGAG